MLSISNEDHSQTKDVITKKKLKKKKEKKKTISARTWIVSHNTWMMILVSEKKKTYKHFLSLYIFFFKTI